MLHRLSLLTALLMVHSAFAHSAPCSRDCDPLITFTPSQPDKSFGHTVISGDDFNGDGFADVLVGAPGMDESTPGKVYAFSGIDGSILLTVEGREKGDRFGQTIALASDFNRDGTRDFVVGAPSASTLREMAGAVSVHSGRDGSLIAFFPGDFEGEQLGYALAAGHYLNNDDVPDIVAGAPAWDLHRGRVIVFSGSNWQTIAEFKGDAQGDRFGESVALIDALHTPADVHLAIGAPGDGSGSVSVYDYQTWEQQHVFRGEQGGEQFGAIVARAGYMNTNSSVDLAIASPGFRGSDGRLGRVVVYDLTTNETVHRLTGRPNEQFGIAVAAAGDMRGDALTDLLVLAQDGGVYVYSGHDGTELHRYPMGALSISGATLEASPGIASDDEFADVVIGYPSEVRVFDCCDCSCHGDPHCNGVVDQRDVTWAIDIAFHGKPSHHDLGTRYDRSDVDCDSVTTITDLVRLVDVVVGGVLPDKVFCNPCK